MSTQEIYYYEPETDITDTIRELACDACIHILNRINKLARWEALDEPRWWLEDIFYGLFGIWWENSPASLRSAIDGELPLDCIGDWERAHIIDFDNLEWRCVAPGCRCECFTHEADGGKCPNCEQGSLFLKL